MQPAPASMFISIQKSKSLTVVPATLEKQFYFPFKELLPSILIEVSRRIVGSVGSGRCWFVYQIYPPTIDTLTGMSILTTSGVTLHSQIPDTPHQI